MKLEQAPIINPFISNQEFHLKAIQIYKRSIQGQGYFMQDSTTKFIVEEQKKVSMYKIGNTTEMNTFMFKVLSQAGRNLFLYIMSSIGENRDKIVLNTEKVCGIMGISRNTHKVALDDLRDNNIIVNSKGVSEYWVNPFYIFRGDRISYYQEICPECIKVVATNSIGDKLLDKV